jgi:hypothetical protein
MNAIDLEPRCSAHNDRAGLGGVQALHLPNMMTNAEWSAP